MTPTCFSSSSTSLEALRNAKVVEATESPGEGSECLCKLRKPTRIQV